MKQLLSVLLIFQVLISCNISKKKYEYTFVITDSVITKSDIDATTAVLLKRLDLLGFNSSKITTSSNRLLLQSNKIEDRIMDKYLINKSELVFYETYTINDLAEFLKNANNKIATLLKADKKSQISNPLFTVLNPVPPIQDNNGRYMYYANVGVVQKKDVAVLKKYLSITKDEFPADMQMLLGKEMENERLKNNFYHEVFFVKNNPSKFMANNNIIHAEAAIDQREYPCVRFKFDAFGSKAWQRMTIANVGRAIAMTLNNKVITAPNVNGAIQGGNCELSGGFNMEEARDLANMLKAGYLPLNLTFSKMKEIN